MVCPVSCGEYVVRGRFFVKEPMNVEMCLTITMKLKDWKELKDQLQECWPSWSLSSLITSMVNKADPCLVEEEEV